MLSTLDRQKFRQERLGPVATGGAYMENVVRELRRNFTAAISSDQNDVTLDPSIAKLSEKISDPGFLVPFSIY